MTDIRVGVGTHVRGGTGPRAAMPRSPSAALWLRGGGIATC